MIKSSVVNFKYNNKIKLITMMEHLIYKRQKDKV